MKPKIKILSTGTRTIVELDGKTIGRGIEAVSFSHDPKGEVKLELSIDLKNFSFMPDGRFDEFERELAKKGPTE